MSFQQFCVIVALSLGIMLPAGAVPRGADVSPLTLRSGAERLAIAPAAAGQWGVRVEMIGRGYSAAFSQAQPLAVDVISKGGESVWLMGEYATAAKHGDGIVCSGVLRTASGTQFQINDVYRALPDAGGFTLSRAVTIARPSPNDQSFNSQFSLNPVAPTAMADNDFFAPGIWYKQNTHVPPKALAASLDDQYYFFREDRLPLPLITVRDRRTGTTLTLAHLNGNPTTFAGEDGLNRIIDARMQFGSLGIINTDRPSPAFLFPGTEGERTYIYGASLEKRWAYRSHPVQVGVPHAYTLLIALRQTPDFPNAVRAAWRETYALAHPPIVPVDLDKVYRDSMDLLATYVHPYNGVISVPFEARVPSGEVFDDSSEMGFVGQALPCAALLLRDGLATHNADAVNHAEQVVDFWAAHSMTPAGMPQDWYNIQPDGTFTWRNYPVYLRIASDGLDGALQAWSVLRAHGQDRPAWLTFCRRYGDWLVGAQNPDGSWAREYGLDGHVIDPITNTTDQPIPFLADLFRVTGDARYRTAALRAGEFCWNSVHLAYAYVGGTPDNPNVMDKEGGMEALAAFLALYDLTQDRKWVAAAAQAADFCETWTYCWNIPMPPDDPKVIYPRHRTTVGLSLIATGQSGSDNFMAAAPFYFFRLFALTGDAHYRDAAMMLLHDTKQMLDWDGTLGYKYPGLLTEALSLPPLRGHGVDDWLPWLTVAVLEPMVNLQRVYGSYDPTVLTQMPHAELLRHDARFSATRGFSSK